jgi:hypothetical protein
MTDPDVLAKRLLQRAHTRDGLPEILIGITFLAVSALQYAWSVLPHRSFAFRASVLVFALGFPLVSLAGPRWLRALRRRYLVEREGYVEHLPRPFPFRRMWLMGVAATAIVLAQVALRPLPDYWVTGFTGVASGFLAGFCGRSPRFYLPGAVMAATGIGVAIAQMSMEMGFLIVFGVMGVLELVLGGTAWIRFLRETQGAVSDER